MRMRSGDDENGIGTDRNRMVGSESSPLPFWTDTHTHTHTPKKKKEEKKREKGKYVSTYHNNMIIIPQAVTN